MIKNNIKRSQKSSYRKYKINENFFNFINDEYSAWLIGFIISDGNISKNNGGYYIRFELAKKDEEILYEILKIMDSDITIFRNKKRNSSYEWVKETSLSERSE